MATKQEPKGGTGGEQKADAAPQQEAKEESAKDASIKEEKTSPKSAGKDAKDTKKPSRDDKKDQRSSGRERGRRSSRDRGGGDHKSRDKEEREVCRNFLHNRCDRGSSCKYYHPRSGGGGGGRQRHGSSEDSEHRPGRGSPSRDAGSGQIICRDFTRNMCTRGTDCRFYHPPPDTNGKKRSSWLTFCHDFRNGHCLRSDCRFFHITREDEESYRATGEIPLHVVDQVVRKAMVVDTTPTGTRPICKEFLRRLCNMKNCRFRHLNQREYEDEVFHALQDEFEKILGPPDRRPPSPKMASPYPVPPPPTLGGSGGGFHDAPHKFGASPGDFREGMRPLEDMRGSLMPLSEYESEPKRPRYFSGDGMFPREEFRDSGDAPRKWDDRVDYWGLERGEAAPRDPYRLVPDMYRNDRTGDRELTELKEAARLAMDENAELRHEVAKVRAQATEEAMAHKAALDKLTLANGTLLEDLRKAQDAARQVELQGQEKLQALDAAQKSRCTDLERKLDLLQKDNTQLREALAKAAAAQKLAEDEKQRLMAEVDDLRAKMRGGHHHHHSHHHSQQQVQQQQQQQQQHGGGGSYSSKNTSRDLVKDRGGEGSSGSSLGFTDMLQSDRHGLDGRDQGHQGRYSSSDTWGTSDKNGRPQYGGSGGGGGVYGSDRGWFQESWPKNTGGSLMGEYQGDDRTRGAAAAAQNSPVVRGSAYGNAPAGTGGDGLLDLPMEARDYRGQEGQYSSSSSSQGRMHFEERDYGLSGYEHSDRAGSSWQTGDRRGRGGVSQGWRRGKSY